MAPKSVVKLTCLLFCVLVLEINADLEVKQDEIETDDEWNNANVLPNFESDKTVESGESSIDMPNVESRRIAIPNTDIPKDGGKFCHSDDLRPSQHYIVGFEPEPESPDVSQISLYGCLQEPYSGKEEWKCDPEDITEICNGPGIMMYQWKQDGCANYMARGELITTGGPYINKVVLVVNYEKGGYQNSSGLLLKLLPSGYNGSPGVSEIVDYYSSAFDYKSKCPEDESATPESVATGNSEEGSKDVGTEEASEQSIVGENLKSSVPSSMYYEKPADEYYSSYDQHVASLSANDGEEYDEYSSIDAIFNYLREYWTAPRRGRYTELESAGFWPQKDIPIGQISGLDIDLLGNLVLFRRGERTWGPNDFDANNVYTHYNPIRSQTVVTVDTTKGEVVDAWGSGSFYLPHGLTIDYLGNTWLTDVALHQVFKFAPGNHVPELTFGEAFVPGDDADHFCKPTDVAVCPKTGDFFIADGYCNNRVVKYAANGTRLFEITAHTKGKTDPRLGKFRIPHSLAIVESREWICVADRENVRIQCFNISDGAFAAEFTSPQFGDEVFAIAYNNKEDVLYVVNGPSMTPSRPTAGFTLSLTSGDVIDMWMPEKGAFNVPHDIAVSEEEGVVYVADIGLNRIWRFIESDDPLNNLL